MQNQAAVEALYSGTFVENYLDVIENMPNEIQRFVSRIRECDLIIYRDLFANIDDLTDDFQKASSNPQAQRAVLAQIQKGLIVAQDVGDEKLALAQAMADLVESKNRFLESSAENLDFERDEREHAAQLRRTASGADGVGSAGGRENTAGGRSTALGSGGPGHNSPAGHHAAGVAGGKGALGAGVKTKSKAAGQPHHAEGASGKDNRTSTGVKRRKKQERHAASNKGGDLTEDDGEPPHKMATTGGGSASGGSGKGGSRGGKRPVSSSNHSGSGSNPSGTNSSGKKKAGSGGSGGGKRGGGGGGSGGGGGGGGFNQNNDDSDPEIDPSLDNIDPDEPTYCLCEQISYGEMIGCDNDLCPLEWFHFNCVNLSSKPKGKWFCPKCRGEKANVMKPKAQFIRELERFNKEREEKNAGSHKH